LNDEPINLTLEQLEQRLSRQPASPLFARLAYEYLNINRSEEAKQLCVKGLELYPNYSTARIVLELCYRLEDSSQTTSATETLDDASEDIEDSLNISKFQEVSVDQVAVEEDIEDLRQEEPVSNQVYTENIPASLDDTSNDTLIEEIIPLPELLAIDVQEIIDESIAEKVADTIEPDTIIHNQFEEGTDNKTIVNTVAAKDIVVSPEVDEMETSSQIKSDDKNNLDEVSQTESLSNEIQSPIETVNQESLEITAPAQIELKNIQQDENVKLEEATQPNTIDDIVENKKTNKVEREQHRPIVSKTLAEIYVSQGEYSEAIETYSLLIVAHPERKKEIEVRIRELEKKLSQAISAENRS
jgi:tetratricopeptide (TPR) repeat protein